MNDEIHCNLIVTYKHGIITIQFGDYVYNIALHNSFVPGTILIQKHNAKHLIDGFNR